MGGGGTAHSGGDDGDPGVIDNSITGYGPNGQLGADGEDGDITLVVNAQINGNVSLQAHSGNIDMTLNDGAGISGTIAAISGSVKTLTFNFSTHSSTDYAAALATLVPANASAGTLTVNGQTFAWSGFTDLVNQITLIVTQAAQAAQAGRDCSRGNRVNYEDCNAPVGIYANLSGVITLRDREGNVLGALDANTLPEPGAEPVLVFSGLVAVDGADVAVNVYRLPNGGLMLAAGDYTFTWMPG